MKQEPRKKPPAEAPPPQLNDPPVELKPRERVEPTKPPPAREEAMRAAGKCMVKEASPAQPDGEKRSDTVTVETITVLQKPMNAEDWLDGRARRAESHDRRGEAPKGRDGSPRGRAPAGRERVVHM